MAKKTKLKGKKALMIEALGATFNVTASCRKVNIDRSTHYDWLKKDPAYKEAYETVPEIRVDFYENALDKLVSQGNPTAIIFALKSKGKHRGWVERQEMEHNVAPVNFTITKHNEPDKNAE